MRSLHRTLLVVFVGVVVCRAAFSDELPPRQTEASLRVTELVKAGDYSEAEQVAREALEAVEREHGADALQTAYAIDDLFGAVRRIAPGSAEALELATRSLALKENWADEIPLELAQSFNNLGIVNHDAGDLSLASEGYRRSIELREAHGGTEDVTFAYPLSNLGLVEYELGNYERAAEYQLRAAEHVAEKSGPDDPAVGTILMNRAGALNDLYRFDEARETFDRAVAILEAASGSEHPDFGLALLNRSTAFRFMGLYAEALDDIRRALPIFETALGPDHPYTAYALRTMGGMLVVVGDFDEAEAVLLRARRLLESGEGADRSQLGLVIYELGMLHQARNQLDLAEEDWREEVAIEMAAWGPGHPRTTQAQLLLGQTLAGLGRLEEGIRVVREVFEAMEEGDTHHSSALEQLGSLLARSGDPAAAVLRFDEAISVGSALFGERHPDIGRIRGRRAGARLALGEASAALEDALAAESIGRENLRLTLAVLTEREALRYAASRVAGRDLLIASLELEPTPETVRRVWDSILRSRGVILDEMAARHAHTAGEGWADLARERTLLANRVVRGPDARHPEAYLESVEDARRRVVEAERALARQGASQTGQSLHDVGLEDVALALGPNDALVAYVRTFALEDDGRVGDARYGAFVLAGGEAEFVPLGRADRIEDALRRWRRAIDRVARAAAVSARELEQLYLIAGEHLRKLIWDPVAPRVGPATRVFLVADGALHQVSWASLPDTFGDYLVESGPLFHYLTAERDLTRPGEDPASSSGGMGLLAMGGPEFDDREIALASTADVCFRGNLADCDEIRSLRFVALPAAEREVAEVAEFWGDRKQRRKWKFWSKKDVGEEVVVLTSNAATEAAFKRHAPGKRTLHLATHAFFLGDCPTFTESRARDADVFAPETALQVANPLLLSGLAWAGANYRQAVSEGAEDGILTAEEIGALDLSGVSWAVLSGCDTGAGLVQTGEGVFGLRRAFEVAGARTVITSLWNVEDESARQWMYELYRQHWEKGRPTAEAVREASLVLLKKRRDEGSSLHPFYWGGFVATGDWR